MKNRKLIVALTAFALSAVITTAVEPSNFTGEYADKKFRNGQGVFQMSLEQKGETVSVFFAAAYNDAHGAAPEADGTGKVTAKGMVEFKWQDSFGNSGTGTIARSGSDIVVSIKPIKVTDSRCVQFYGDNMRLKPAGKK
jgi:hypothetical protein